MLSVRSFLVFVASIVLVVSFLFWYQARPSQVSESSHIEVGGQTIRVTLADTPESRARGLSGRAGLAPNEGMLFVFGDDDYHAFWMKDMQFSIDIVWISYSGEIVDIREKVSPDTYPAVFTPRQPARYVLELPSEWLSKHSISVGDLVHF